MRKGGRATGNYCRKCCKWQVKCTHKHITRDNTGVYVWFGITKQGSTPFCCAAGLVHDHSKQTSEMLNSVPLCIPQLNSNETFKKKKCWHAFFTLSGQAKSFVFDSWLFSRPLTGTLSLELQCLGAACSGGGRANHHHCFICLHKLSSRGSWPAPVWTNRGGTTGPPLPPKHHQQSPAPSSGSRRFTSPSSGQPVSSCVIQAFSVVLHLRLCPN